MSEVFFENTDLAFSSTAPDVLAPGGSYTIHFPSTIAATLLSELVVKANPVNEAGDEITGAQGVTGSDTAGVVLEKYTPSISVENTVSVQVSST